MYKNCIHPILGVLLLLCSLICVFDFSDHYREQKEYHSAVEEYTEACDLFELESCKKIIQAARNECIALAEKETQLKDIDKSLCEDAKYAMLWYKKANVLIDLEKFDGKGAHRLQI